jgi:hypothetical protein
MDSKIVLTLTDKLATAHTQTLAAILPIELVKSELIFVFSINLKLHNPVED